MPTYRARNADTYGHAVGVLLLDYRAPRRVIYGSCVVPVCIGTEEG